jgi:hypothetical protein
MIVFVSLEVRVGRNRRRTIVSGRRELPTVRHAPGRRTAFATFGPAAAL